MEGGGSGSNGEGRGMEIGVLWGRGWIRGIMGRGEGTEGVMGGGECYEGTEVKTVNVMKQDNSSISD